MKQEALARYLALPTAIHRQSGALLSLSQYLSDPAAARSIEELPLESQLVIVEARWKAGEWSDIIYGSEGLVDRDRAIHELEAQTEIGKYLLRMEIRAMQFAIEAARSSP
ncbi:MAG: hypothetical protein JST54_06965 [Deltaproteobacteria bacterium]|nr:hypothetical protein [Deltaproteobacteria bacterium]